MTQYDNTNRFQIWKNDRKAEDRDPDYTGTLNVDGVEYFVDSWRRKPDANERAPALSGRVKIKTKQPSPAPHLRGHTAAEAEHRLDLTPRRPNGRPAPSYADLDDDIPF
jgi:hypothetical protein